MDTTNLFFVGARGDEICIMKTPARVITKQEALNLAAWIVALADDEDQFNKLLESVQNT